MDSILTSVKKMLGISHDYTDFDPEIIMCINSTFMILQQIGLGPQNGFSIEDDSAKWSDFITSDKLEGVKSYMHLKVRLLFDPPQGSGQLDSIYRLISELEWRLRYGNESEV